jgi:hypothetical protein
LLDVFLLDAPTNFTKWMIILKRSNASFLFKLWTSNNAFHSASISWWRMSTGTWNLRIVIDSLKTWYLAWCKYSSCLLFRNHHSVGWEKNSVLRFAVDWLKVVLLMHVLVKATINFVTCHFNVNFIAFHSDLFPRWPTPSPLFAL